MTENGYRTHVGSKKHKDAEIKAFAQSSQRTKPTTAVSQTSPTSPKSTPLDLVDKISAPSNATSQINNEIHPEEDDVEQSVEQKIALARTQLSPNQCLFCPESSENLDINLQHMSQMHSFFVPDAEYLVDINGLIAYLGEKVAVGNVCIYCNKKGRAFRTLDAVRKHMLDKSHCKIAYDTENDRLEISDFYDFSSSYPDYGSPLTASQRRSAVSNADSTDDEEWEDTDDNDDDDVDEIVDKDGPLVPLSGNDDADSLPNNELTYGDSLYELVLPSGARIGHRSLRRYYAQSLPRYDGKVEDSNSGAALVRHLLTDRKSAVIPHKGGFGAFGAGAQVIKVRNTGEAREAGRHVREYRDQRRREEFKTKVGFKHNHQKHYRDPLLQVRSNILCLYAFSNILFNSNGIL